MILKNALIMLEKQNNRLSDNISFQKQKPQGKYYLHHHYYYTVLIIIMYKK